MTEPALEVVAGTEASTDAEVRRSLQDGGCLLIQGTREAIEGIQGFRHEIVRDSLWEVSARLELPPAANTAEEPSR